MADKHSGAGWPFSQDSTPGRSSGVSTVKRGSGAAKVSLEDAVSFAPSRGRDLEALDDALKALAEIDPRKAQVIEFRFFGGFNVEETARALDISVATVGREQRMAEAWLHREVARGQAPPES